MDGSVTNSFIILPCSPLAATNGFLLFNNNEKIDIYKKREERDGHH